MEYPFTPLIDHEVTIYGLNDSASGQNWGESLITWNNAPGNVTTSDHAFSEAVTLGTIVRPVTTNVLDLFTLSGQPLIDFLNADSDGLVTFMMSDTTGIITGSVFASKESTTGSGPQLSITSVPLPTTMLLFAIGMLALRIK